ncbi:MAG TPA: hypothetical protein VK698_15500 [Kofleriaceae bacterium]|nr:hypothetical protein [Kofleriaceae bacterium]
MKSVIWIVMLVVLAVGCTKDEPTNHAALTATPVCAKDVVEVKRPTVDPVKRVEGGTLLYVYQDGDLRTILDVQRTGDVVVPLRSVDDGKNPLYFGTCKRELGQKIDDVVRVACIQCNHFFEPCCGEQN